MQSTELKERTFDSYIQYISIRIYISMICRKVFMHDEFSHSVQNDKPSLHSVLCVLI